jgi:hypothetical protein
MIPQNVFKRIRLSFDPVEVLREFRDIEKRFGEHRQICLTSVVDSDDPLFDGAGKASRPETDFVIFNREFEGTIFEEIYLSLPYRLGRLRFMVVPPRTCYSFHSDTETRIHLAIKTDVSNFFIVENNPEECWRFHIPADGGIYEVDTRRRHTFLNTGEEPRVHLVGNVIFRKPFFSR